MEIPSEGPVVVGVNGTAAGLAAVRLAAREAVARGRDLRVVHAFTWPSTYPGAGDGAQDQDYASSRHAAAQIVDEAVATARRSTPAVHVAGFVVDGLPSRVLLQQSRAAVLLFLGDDDLATTGSLPIDSVLMQAVSRAWCPVVVARGLRPPTGPLLAAIDGSPTSLLALRHAALAAQRRDVAVEVTHVVDRAGGKAEEDGRRMLAKALAAVPELTGARSRLLIGDPAGALVRASRHARMVIVGPRGRDGAALLGPVATELLHRCACPTVFVHGATAEERPSAGTVPWAAALAT
jgi:nucleotide-binding universal stress UspA family protein